MEDRQVFTTGERVEQMCITCGVERGHIVASITKNGKITRVSCPICGSRAPYKRGITRHASTKAGAPYDRAHTYRRGETMAISVLLSLLAVETRSAGGGCAGA